MCLRDSFERSGQWLFRWRSYLPLVLFVVVVTAMWDHAASGIGASHGASGEPDLAWEIFCFVTTLAGLVIRSMVVGATPSGTSGRNTSRQVADVLNTTGWYSVVRHPLYVGNYLMWLGVALFPGIWWLAVIVSLAFWLYYERIMFAEEAFLRQRFGAAFEEWSAKTPAFVPNFGQWVPSSLPFSFKTVLRREYSGLYGVVASIAFLELVQSLMATGRPSVDPVWGGVFAVTTVLYLLLLALKRGTRLLAVHGRS